MARRRGGLAVNGAEALLRTSAAAGVDLCLANPGTTEMALVAALDRVPQVRSVLGPLARIAYIATLGTPSNGVADRRLGTAATTILHAARPSSSVRGPY